MRIIIIGREFSEYDREVREWTRELTERTGREVEKIDPDSIEGEGFCRARDITQYPTVVVMMDDGGDVEQWSGTPLPAIDDVMSYFLN